MSVLRWLLSPEAQELTTRLLYSPLPTRTAAAAARLLDSMTYEGKKMK